MTQRCQRERFLDGVNATIVALCVAAACMAVPAYAASPREIKAAIDTGENCAKDGRNDDAIAHLKEAVQGLEEALAGDRPPSSLRILARRCTALLQQLEQAGADVEGITVPSGVGSSATRKMPADSPQAGLGVPAAGGGGVSFARDIAPVLVRSCGGCHVNGKKGEFHIPTYAALMQSGAVQPGVGQASRIVEVIASGDMPRGGGKVAADDLATLIRWIDMGARYDGGNPTLPIATLGAGPQPGGNGGDRGRADMEDVQVVSLKPGEVSFAVDVAPVLIESCLACHGGLETESGFSMASFSRLLRGGGSGPAIEPGNATDSLVVQKIRGTGGIDGQRMPLGKPPLGNEIIARIAKWIDEGGRLDVAAAGGDLRAIASAGRALHLTDEELRMVRQDAARGYWRQFLPDESPQTALRGGLMVIGNLPAGRVEAIAEVADACWGELMERLGTGKNGQGSSDVNLIKGGITLYAFAKSYDFSEFWLIRHRADRPRGITSTAGISGDVIYAALLVADSALDEADQKQGDLAFLITRELGAAVFLARGAPMWFAEGAGGALAADAVPRAPLARALRSDFPEAIGEISSPQDILVGRADPQAVSTVTTAFIDRLSSSGAKLPAFLAALDAGQGFEEAFAEVFRNTPEALLEGWLMQEGRRNRRR
jgi:hypothetical protein